MQYAVVDLFCGIGGLTHGLIKAGLNVVAGLDIDSTCRYAYETNNKPAKFIEADITDYSSDELAKFYPEDSIKILVGCAPCQPFSKYTKRYRKEEKEKGRQGDSWQKDNKWKLLNSFADKVEKIKPDIISMENVPELEKEEIFKEFKEKLEKLEYSINYSIVYCPDYGIPQIRKRLVLLASRFGKIELIKPSYTPENYRTVQQVIGELPKLESGQIYLKDPLHYCTKLSKKNILRIKNSHQGGTWHEWDDSLKLKCHKKKSGKSYGAVYGRMSWNKPSPTITTQFYGYGNGRFGHPDQDRAISLREGAILQSFPPEYAIIEPNKAYSTKMIGTHIGNAVPVELGRAIGKSILKHIKEEKING